MRRWPGSGWRPARGALKLVFVSDEETGGDVGAHWLCTEHPDKVRCDMLLNEGGGEAFEYGGHRHYGVCCAEKGIFRFNVTAHGVAGHASLPRTGDNALLKLAPVLAALADPPEAYAVTEAPAALLRGLGEDPADPGAALAAIAAEEPGLRTLMEPMLSRHAHADDGLGLDQDQRDPVARAGADRLPRAARPRRGRRPAADRRGAGIGRPTGWRSSSPSG